MAASRDLRSDLLKVGHHGSATSSTPEFMNAVQPAWAIISVGTRKSIRASATGDFGTIAGGRSGDLSHGSEWGGQLFTLTADRSPRSWRVFADIDFGSFVGIGRAVDIPRSGDVPDLRLPGARE